MHQELPHPDDVYRILCNVAIDMPDFVAVSYLAKKALVPPSPMLNDIYTAASIDLQSLIVSELLDDIEGIGTKVLKVPLLTTPAEALKFAGVNCLAFDDTLGFKATILAAPNVANLPITKFLSDVYRTDVYTLSDLRLADRVIIIPMQPHQSNVVRVHVSAPGHWVENICQRIPCRYTPIGWLQELVRTMNWPKPLKPIYRSVMPAPADIYGVDVDIYAVPIVLDFAEVTDEAL